MLIVCIAWAAEESCDVFNVIMPPAGAILTRPRSLRPPNCDFLASGCEVVVGAVREVVGVAAVSWRWTDCHSPVAVLKRI